ncbi:MAG: hypothetical protein Q9N68_14060 [Gammaproteobacteria bacterium]|nr:hypothetical protein [Gammaproteobacteria bacterium]
MSEPDNHSDRISFSLSSGQLDKGHLLDLLTELHRDLATLPEVQVEQAKKGVKEGSKGMEVELLNTVMTLSTAAGGGFVALLVAWLRRNRRVEVVFEEGNPYGLKKVSAASLEELETLLETLKHEPKSPIIKL